MVDPEERRKAAVINGIMGPLSVEPVEYTQLVVVSFEATDRQLAAEVVNTLAREIKRMTEMPDVRARLHGLGAEPVGNTPEVFEAYLRAELPKWAKVIAAAGITPD